MIINHILLSWLFRFGLAVFHVQKIDYPILPQEFLPFHFNNRSHLMKVYKDNLSISSAALYPPSNVAVNMSRE